MNEVCPPDCPMADLCSAIIDATWDEEAETADVYVDGVRQSRFAAMLRADCAHKVLSILACHGANGAGCGVDARQIQGIPELEQAVIDGFAATQDPAIQALAAKVTDDYRLNS